MNLCCHTAWWKLHICSRYFVWFTRRETISRETKKQRRTDRKREMEK